MEKNKNSEDNRSHHKHISIDTLENLDEKHQDYEKTKEKNLKNEKMYNSRVIEENKKFLIEENKNDLKKENFDDAKAKNLDEKQQFFMNEEVQGNQTKNLKNTDENKFETKKSVKNQEKGHKNSLDSKNNSKKPKNSRKNSYEPNVIKKPKNTRKNSAEAQKNQSKPDKSSKNNRKNLKNSKSTGTKKKNLSKEKSNENSLIIENQNVYTIDGEDMIINILKEESPEIVKSDTLNNFFNNALPKQEEFLLSVPVVQPLNLLNFYSPSNNVMESKFFSNNDKSLNFTFLDSDDMKQKNHEKYEKNEKNEENEKNEKNTKTEKNIKNDEKNDKNNEKNDKNKENDEKKDDKNNQNYKNDDKNDEENIKTEKKVSDSDGMAPNYIHYKKLYGVPKDPLDSFLTNFAKSLLYTINLFSGKLIEGDSSPLSETSKTKKSKRPVQRLTTLEADKLKNKRIRMEESLKISFDKEKECSESSKDKKEEKIIKKESIKPSKKQKLIEKSPITILKEKYEQEQEKIEKVEKKQPKKSFFSKNSEISQFYSIKPEYSIHNTISLFYTKKQETDQSISFSSSSEEDIQSPEETEESESIEEEKPLNQDFKKLSALYEAQNFDLIKSLAKTIFFSDSNMPKMNFYEKNDAVNDLKKDEKIDEIEIKNFQISLPDQFQFFSNQEPKFLKSEEIEAVLIEDGSDLENMRRIMLKQQFLEFSKEKMKVLEDDELASLQILETAEYLSDKPWLVSKRLIHSYEN